MKRTHCFIDSLSRRAATGLVALFLTTAGSGAFAAQDICWMGFRGQFFGVIQYCVSSVLPPQDGATFEPENLMGGGADAAKAWCEGAPGLGVGETIMIQVEGGPAFRRLLVRNGFGKSPETYAGNARVKAVEISADTGLSATVTLPDTNEVAPVDLPGMAQHWIRLKIVEVYPGAQSENACLGFVIPDFEYEEELLLKEQGLLRKKQKQ